MYRSAVTFLFPAVRAPLVALGIVLAQAALVVAVAPPPPLVDAFTHYDSEWYADIVDHGYTPVASGLGDRGPWGARVNTGYLPGFPVAARIVQAATGLSTRVALVATALLAAWSFWTYVLLLARELGVGRRGAAVLVAAIVCHPAAFYLVVGYSEALLLTGVTGLLYWSRRRGVGAAILAALHGFAATATRLTGAPSALAPLAAWCARGPRSLHSFARATAVCVASASGLLAWFAFCAIRFASAGEYFTAQRLAHGNRADLWVLLDPATYTFLPPDPRNPNEVSFAAVGVQALFLAAFVALEFVRARRGLGGWRARVDFLWCAATLHALAIAGVHSTHMVGMIRYQFCSYAILAMAFAGALSERGTSETADKQTPMARWLVGVFAAVALAVGFALHAYYAWRFTRGIWVA